MDRLTLADHFLSCDTDTALSHFLHKYGAGGHCSGFSSVRTSENMRPCCPILLCKAAWQMLNLW